MLRRKQNDKADIVGKERTAIDSRRNILGLGAASMLLASCSNAQESVGDKKRVVIPTGSQHEYDTYHYAPAVRVGRFVWISGHGGVDEKGEVPKDFESQIDLLFQNIGRTLNAAGATFDDIVELTSLHVDFPNGLETILKVKDRYLKQNYPAWTTIGVSRLEPAEMIMECKAVAVINSGR